MIQYIQSEPIVSGVVIAAGVFIAAGVALYAYKKHGLTIVRQKAYSLFLVAEHLYTESGSGEKKFTYVVGAIYKILPPIFVILLPQKQLEKLVQIWFDEIKDLLDDGKLNDSTKGDQV